MPSKGYIIADQGMKGQLPRATWEAARLRVNKLFQSAGGLTAVYTQSPPRPGVMDGVVQVCGGKATAEFCFRRNVYNQLNALRGKFPNAGKLQQRFNQPSHYNVDVGRSYALKAMWQSSTSGPTLVVVTFGVVRLDSALACWTGLLSGKPNTTPATIRSAPSTDQTSFGVVLGNLVAHELRHQLGPSSNGTGLGHSGSGLGKDGASFADPKIAFTDISTILASVAKLRALAQAARRSHP